MSMRWVAAYDVSRDLDRQRVAATLLASGVRLQRSVFEVATAEPTQLLAAVEGHLNLDRDVFQLFRQCRSCSGESHAVGQTGPRLRERFWIA
jgi:CRISPR-associated endonuclease Cas2